MVPSIPLFDEILLPTNIPIPSGFRLRALRNDDYGYLDLLKQLSSVGYINQLGFRKQFDAMKKAKSYYIVLLEHNGSSKIVGAATLLIEFKYIHEAGTRGRIEDVVIDGSMRGEELELLLNRVLVDMAENLGVYKLSLECKTEKIAFYNKLGYTKTHHFLDQLFDEPNFISFAKPADDSLFNDNAIPTDLEIPDGIRARALRSGDMDYLNLLEQLTSVGHVTEYDFQQRFLSMRNTGSYYIVILEDINSSKIVGAATLVVELKYIHECGRRGRVEDVVVDESMRGKKLGALLNKALVEMAKNLGIYKLSLECKTELIPFYNKFGYNESIHFMVQRFDEPPVITLN